MASPLSDAMRAVDKMDSDLASLHDNEQLAMAIAAVDHVRSQKKADSWTANDADAIRAVWGVLAALHDAKNSTQLPATFTSFKAVDQNPTLAAARRVVETAVDTGPQRPESTLERALREAQPVPVPGAAPGNAA